MSEHFSVDSKNLKRPQQLCEAVSHTQFYRHKKFFRNRVWIEAATNINPAALQSASKTSRLESGNVKHHKEPNHLIFTEISMDWEDDIYLDCSCRRSMDFSPPVDRQANSTGSPVSNRDLLEQLISAQNSTSRQLATLSSQVFEMREQITEQKLLIKGVNSTLEKKRQHKQSEEPAPKRVKRAHSVAIAEAARRLHNSVNNPQKYDPQTGISSPHNQAVTTHLLKEIAKCLTDADPEMIKGCSIIQTYCPNLSCQASIHHQNYIGCVCSSDFCNTNITWNQTTKQTEYKQARDTSDTSDLLRATMLIIPAGGLLLFLSLVTALKWKTLLKCRRLVTPPNTHDILEVSNTDLSKHLEMQKVVACGHFATVWQGTFQGLSVAVKVFPPALQKEFDKEKDVYKLPLMRHSGIVRFLGEGKLGKEFVLVLELATQGSLNAFLSRTVCDWAGTLKLAQTLSQGLVYLHADLKMNGVYKPAVAHCDLSSSNVLVRTDGSCALCDFGCSTVLQGQTLQGYSATAEGRIQMGTLQYVSPEILEGCVNLSSGRCFLQGDVYSLGLLLWEVLMRCSDLCKESPVPEHMLPYEAELGCTPSLDDLLTFVLEKRFRPTIPHQWARVSQGFYLRELLEDCWDHDADARLTAECAANRLASLTL